MEVEEAESSYPCWLGARLSGSGDEPSPPSSPCCLRGGGRGGREEAGVAMPVCDSEADRTLGVGPLAMEVSRPPTEGEEKMGGLGPGGVAVEVSARAAAEMKEARVVLEPFGVGGEGLGVGGGVKVYSYD